RLQYDGRERQRGCLKRLSRQDRGALFLSQGRYSGLHQGSLRLSRQLRGHQEDGRGVARNFERHRGLAEEISGEVQSAFSAAGRSRKENRNDVWRGQRKEHVRQESRRDSADDLCHWSRRQDQAHLQQRKSRRPRGRSTGVFEKSEVRSQIARVKPRWCKL